MAAELNLAEMISQLAVEARQAVQADIPRFLAARDISSLFHFTSIRTWSRLPRMDSWGASH